MILDKVNNPDDLKKLSRLEKRELADDIRELIIDTTSQNGGHLASNLGVVELTIAIHSYFNAPTDKIVWDVGHQTYVHKILTGRKNKFNTLRQMDGIAGFPRIKESKYDTFDTGHSSTSISVSLGMARARDILGHDEKVVAVIGDGALTGGMALEAMNDAGTSKTNLIVILNDNEMSISKNKGGLSKCLSKLRTRRGYVRFNSFVKENVENLPFGNIIVKIVTKLKNTIKGLVIPKMYFENIGFTYLGPVDGHNIEEMEDIFKRCENISGPILIHVITKKGKGYKYAEDYPDKFHSVAMFDKETGEILTKGKKDYSTVMGEHLLKIADSNELIVASSAAMEEGTGLTSFAKKYPNRFYNVEIAEQHALTMVAGMARSGLKPVIPIYSSFLQRGYDQLLHDIALENLGVVICVDRAGIVGSDGETHQGLYDLSYLMTIPNISIMAPKNFIELKKMLDFAIDYNKPIAIRYPRGTEEDYKIRKCSAIKYGKAEILKTGSDLTIVAIGKMTARSLSVANRLENDGINVEVINARFAKPIDIKTIEESFKKTKKLITIEDGSIYSGFGMHVASMLKKEGKIINLGYPDKFIKQGTVSEIEKKYKLDEESIYRKIKTMFRKNKKSNIKENQITFDF